MKCTIQGSHKLSRQRLAALVADAELPTRGAPAASGSIPFTALTRVACASRAQGRRRLPHGWTSRRRKGTILICRAGSQVCSVAIELIGSFVAMGRVPSSQTASVIWAHRGDGFWGPRRCHAMSLNVVSLSRCVCQIDRGRNLRCDYGRLGVGCCPTSDQSIGRRRGGFHSGQWEARATISRMVLD